MKNRAHFLGAVAGVAAALGGVVYVRTLPPRCTGGVSIELRPPLSEPGTYHFRLLVGEVKQPCEFDVPLPVGRRVETPCGLALELKTRVAGGQTSIVGLTVGASPKTLGLRITKQGEALYDASLTPVYGPYETPREESRLFCGERALVETACVRGSSGCAPFDPACDGPEDCVGGKVCCTNPDWGRDYGPRAATECAHRRGCLDRFGFVACHADADCPSDMRCSDTSLSKDFKRPVLACQPKPAALR